MGAGDGPLALRPAGPEDLAQLEAWCHALRKTERPPFVSVTLSAFLRAPERGALMIVADGGAEVGFVVVSRLWSNRLEAEVAVIDDLVLEPGTDAELVVFEAARHAGGLGAAEVLVRGADGSLRACP
jgi:hypothetical protein